MTGVRAFFLKLPGTVDARTPADVDKLTNIISGLCHFSASRVPRVDTRVGRLSWDGRCFNLFRTTGK